jgi:hypothetical protein
VLWWKLDKLRLLLFFYLNDPASIGLIWVLVTLDERRERESRLEDAGEAKNDAEENE